MLPSVTVYTPSVTHIVTQTDFIVPNPAHYTMDKGSSSSQHRSLLELPAQLTNSACPRAHLTCFPCHPCTSGRKAAE